MYIKQMFALPSNMTIIDLRIKLNKTLRILEHYLKTCSSESINGILNEKFETEDDDDMTCFDAFLYQLNKANYYDDHGLDVVSLAMLRSSSITPMFEPNLLSYDKVKHLQWCYILLKQCQVMQPSSNTAAAAAANEIEIQLLSYMRYRHGGGGGGDGDKQWTSKTTHINHIMATFLVWGNYNAIFKGYDLLIQHNITCDTYPLLHTFIEWYPFMHDMTKYEDFLTSFVQQSTVDVNKVIPSTRISPLLHAYQTKNLVAQRILLEHPNILINVQSFEKQSAVDFMSNTTLQNHLNSKVTLKESASARQYIMDYESIDHRNFNDIHMIYQMTQRPCDMKRKKILLLHPLITTILDVYYKRYFTDEIWYILKCTLYTFFMICLPNFIERIALRLPRYLHTSSTQMAIHFIMAGIMLHLASNVKLIQTLVILLCIALLIVSLLICRTMSFGLLQCYNFYRQYYMNMSTLALYLYVCYNGSGGIISPTFMILVTFGVICYLMSIHHPKEVLDDDINYGYRNFQVNFLYKYLVEGRFGHDATIQPLDHGTIHVSISKIVSKSICYNVPEGLREAIENIIT